MLMVSGTNSRKRKQTNYKKGRAFEYRIMKFLRNKGYYCLRAYASKGLYDVIAIPPKPLDKDKWFNYPLLIQAKLNGYVPPKEREKLSDEKWQGNVIIAYRDDKHKMAFKTVRGERLINDAFLIRS